MIHQAMHTLQYVPFHAYDANNRWCALNTEGVSVVYTRRRMKMRPRPINRCTIMSRLAYANRERIASEYNGVIAQ
jgi:hypothetical protein